MASNAEAHAYSSYLTQQQLVERVEVLERALLLLARHVRGTGGWYSELQQALDAIPQPPESEVH